MANKFILIKPLITEKSEGLAGTQNNYCFQVDKRANKLEIKKAIEDFYGVNVLDVNTAVAPGKNKARYTKAGFIQGMKSAYKKAFVTVAEGETIDLYANI